MKESDVREKFGLIEKELEGLAEKTDELDDLKKEMDDILTEIKGLKLFLSRAHPEFKKQFPEIIKKLKA